MTNTIQSDSQGRLNLGKKYACATFLIEVDDNEDIVLKKAAVIPERELWLLKNPKALKSVHRGIQQARENKLHRLDLNELEE